MNYDIWNNKITTRSSITSSPYNKLGNQIISGISGKTHDCRKTILLYQLAFLKRRKTRQIETDLHTIIVVSLQTYVVENYQKNKRKYNK